MVTFDTAEKVHPKSFELIGADACSHRIAGRIKIGLDRAVAEFAHGQACD